MTTRPPMRLAFRAMQNPNYRLYWFGQLVSQVGTWMQSLAQAWLALRLSNSALVLGTIASVQFLPITLLSLFGGVLADRARKRQLMVITQSLLLLQALVLGVLTGTGLIRLSYLYVLAALLGVVNAVDLPTRQAFIAEMIGRDDLPNAVALNAMLFNSSRLLGPALGGLTIAAVGIAGCFYLNAVSFLAVIGSVLLMRPERFFAVPRIAKGRVSGQLNEGLRYALASPDIALIIIMVGVLGLFGYNFQILLPLFARFVLGSGAAGFGVLSSALGGGALIGALGFAFIGRPTRRALFISAAMFTGLLFCVGFSRWWLVILPLLVVTGICSQFFQTIANTRLQLTSPPHMRGRMMSIYSLLFQGSTPVGSTIVGAVAERLGISSTFFVMAILCGTGVLGAGFYLRHARGHMQAEGELFNEVAPAQADDGVRLDAAQAAPARAKEDVAPEAS